jgi:hypothetical protein
MLIFKKLYFISFLIIFCIQFIYCFRGWDVVTMGDNWWHWSAVSFSLFTDGALSHWRGGNCHIYGVFKLYPIKSSTTDFSRQSMQSLKAHYAPEMCLFYCIKISLFSLSSKFRSLAIYLLYGISVTVKFSSVWVLIYNFA